MRIRTLILIFVLAAVGVAGAHSLQAYFTKKHYNQTMLVTSPAFNNEEPMPATYTCDGEGVSPELQLSEVPDNAEALAVIVDDPDAPNGTFTHWAVWNIDPKTQTIPSGTVPSGGVEGANDGGQNGFLAACPPPGHGIHHYHFKAYALDAKLNLPAGVSREELEKEISAHKIAQGELIGTYAREQ